MPSATCACEIMTSRSTPSDFSADVRVFGDEPKCEAFVVIHLNVDDTKIKLFLPVTSYQAARSIADLWPALGNPAAATPKLSEEARHLTERNASVVEFAGAAE